MYFDCKNCKKVTHLKTEPGTAPPDYCFDCWKKEVPTTDDEAVASLALFSGSIASESLSHDEAMALAADSNGNVTTTSMTLLVELVVFLLESYSSKGVRQWFNRNRTELGGLTPAEFVRASIDNMNS